MKISELKEIKTIRRPTKEFDGKGNMLCIINLYPAPSDFMDNTAGLYGTRVVFSMNLNNKYSQTYVVDKIEKSKIIEILKSC